jgi:hypothetical protein
MGIRSAAAVNIFVGEKRVTQKFHRRLISNL